MAVIPSDASVSARSRSALSPSTAHANSPLKSLRPFWDPFTMPAVSMADQSNAEPSALARRLALVCLTFGGFREGAVALGPQAFTLRRELLEIDRPSATMTSSAQEKEKDRKHKHKRKRKHKQQKRRKRSRKRRSHKERKPSRQASKPKKGRSSSRPFSPPGAPPAPPPPPPPSPPPPPLISAVGPAVGLGAAWHAVGVCPPLAGGRPPDRSGQP